jgi:hypothetical protein
MISLLRKFALSVLLSSMLASAFSVAAYAQSQSINGSIRGTITDPSGMPVAGATVKLTNLDTGYTREVVTDSMGLYVAPALPIGTYSVSSAASGFSPLNQKGIRLNAGTDAEIDQHLTVGTVATEVQVSSDAPIIDPDRVDVGRTISAEETQNLPLTSRNPYNFILFQPGISGHPNPENGIPRTLNTNGLVDRVNFQLDGMVDTETDRYGLRLFAISDSYVQQINTISNSYLPEFGNTAGVIYNSITYSGTNAYHGEAMYIWRPRAGSSCPILNNCDPSVPGGVIKPSLHVDDFVGRVGGPVIKDRFFFFAAYEHLKRANPTANTITVANRTALEALGEPASDFGTASTVQYAQWLDLRGDYKINNKNQFFVRYNYFRNRYPFNTAVGGLDAISAAADFQDRAHIIGAQLITTFRPNLLNEFRGSWPYRNEHHVADPLTGAGPQVSISGVAIFGGSTGVGDKFQEKIPSFNDNVTYIKGAHTIKAGVGFQKNNDDQLADVYTQYTFASLAAYTAAKNGPNTAAAQGYSSVSASIGQPGAAYHSVFFDFFGQDTWQVRKNLLLTYGLRYDQYRAPTPPAGEPFIYTQSFNTPKANFSPRLGLAYSVSSKTVVRANAGIFYEATPTNTWYNPLYSNGAAGTGNFIATISGGTACSPYFPNSVQTAPAGCALVSGLQSIYGLTPKFKNEYTWNGNLQIAQQISSNNALTVGYILTNGRNMQFLRNLNPINPITALSDGRPVYSTAVNANTRLFPQFGNITYEDTGSNSSYNAFTATFDHRMSAGLSASISYTWSHAISNTPEGNSYEFSNTVEDNSDPRRDRGNSGINRPDSLTSSIVYQPVSNFGNKFVDGAIHGNEFGLLANMSSGDEQNITTSTKVNNDPLAIVRPLFVGRDSVRGPSIYQFDLRYTRDLGTYFERVKPRLLIQANNIFNHSNFTSLNTAASVQNCVASGANTTPGYNPCINALTPSAGTTVIAGAITSAPTLLPSSTLLEARILEFGLKIDF